MINKSNMVCYDGIVGGKYYLVDTLPKFEEFMEEFEKQTVVAVDTETNGLDWVRHRACGIVVGWGPEKNFYLPIRHQTGEKQLDIDIIRPRLAAKLADPHLQVLLWNQ